MKRAILCAVLIACGCASAPPVKAADVPIAPFEPPAWSTEQGSASVTGQAFLRTLSGEVRTCAGSRVLLVPVTAYSQSVLDSRLAGGPVVPVSQMAPFVRSDICDAQGNFRFDGLPDGRWFVESSVFWRSRYGALGGGGLLCAVTTQGGQVRIVMTDGDVIPIGCAGPRKHRCAEARMVYGLFDQPGMTAAR